jgi:hypothetical protein
MRLFTGLAPPIGIWGIAESVLVLAYSTLLARFWNSDIVHLSNDIRNALEIGFEFG